MIINEMMITSSQLHALSIPKLLNIERVSVFKLLAVCVSSDLRWNHHINYVCKRASSRLHFFATAERAVVLCEDMLLFYIAVIRPVMEYAAPVWHTAELAERIESIQKRAF